MLMIVFVPNVDNLPDKNDMITFVNIKQGSWNASERPCRDFGIRGELCNFAANFEQCA